MFTIVASSTTMNCARQTIARTSQRFGSVRVLEVMRFLQISGSGTPVTVAQPEWVVRLCDEGHYARRRDDLDARPRCDVPGDRRGARADPPAHASDGPRSAARRHQ